MTNDSASTRRYVFPAGKAKLRFPSYARWKQQALACSSSFLLSIASCIGGISLAGDKPVGCSRFEPSIFDRTRMRSTSAGLISKFMLAVKAGSRRLYSMPRCPLISPFLYRSLTHSPFITPSYQNKNQMPDREIPTGKLGQDAYIAMDLAFRERFTPFWEKLLFSELGLKLDPALVKFTYARYVQLVSNLWRTVMWIDGADEAIKSCEPDRCCDTQ